MQSARFAHHRLLAFPLVREALVEGDAIAKGLPRGYAKLADQLQRALLGAYLQFSEGAAREGNDRNARLRWSRAEAAEAAAALEAAVALRLTASEPAERVIALLDRFSAMVTGLGKLNK